MKNFNSFLLIQLFLSLCGLTTAFASTVSNVTMDEAQRIFEQVSKANSVASTCSATALVWTHEISRLNYSAGKAFVFLTKESTSFSERNWWFHVAPYVLVNGEVIVLDKDYERGPVPLPYWIARHHGSADECKVVDRSLNDYLRGGPSSDCHVRLTADTSIWMPYQINLDDSGNLTVTPEFYRSSLINACKTAFGRTPLKWSKKRCEEFLKL